MPAAKKPPRAWALRADCSSSAATCSSGRADAWAQCHARRSGSRSGSVTSASAWCTACRSRAVAIRYAAERTNGCRKAMCWPKLISPDSMAPAAGSAPRPSRSAACQSRGASPSGSAAAVRSRSRVSGGRTSSRRTKLSSIRPASVPALRPSASSAAVQAWGSSSRASGLPRVSATIRSRTRGSTGPGSTESRRARASASSRPRISSSASPDSSWSSPSRTAKTMTTDSASSRRATNARIRADIRSSHWASSTTHSTGWWAAASDSRFSTARPTRNRSGAVPLSRPNAVPRASCCGRASRSIPSRKGRQS